MLQELGFDIIKHKLVPPAQVVCLGVKISTTNFTGSIAPLKMQEIIQIGKVSDDKTSCSKRELQPLLGKLLYISKCVKASRVFLN